MRLDVPHLARGGGNRGRHSSALGSDNRAPEFAKQVDRGPGSAVGAGDIGFRHTPRSVDDVVDGRLAVELGEAVEHQRRRATARDDEVLRRAMVDVVRRRHVIGQVEHVLGPSHDEHVNVGIDGFEQAARACAASLSSEHGVPQPSSGAGARSLAHRRATVEPQTVGRPSACRRACSSIGK